MANYDAVEFKIAIFTINWNLICCVSEPEFMNAGTLSPSQALESASPLYHFAVVIRPVGLPAA